ncbi:hypothetical protein Glove_300g117 [Diversispora epigaea]|uniref:BTB domain-containing protein n=1 Tax=Diversispora epigaea TaxID=1348612 RepID=A0A397HXY6_9GLOM|nr:hypothetical protein Glove_300g117 [Diversispora epigaea]
MLSSKLIKKKKIRNLLLHTQYCSSDKELENAPTNDDHIKNISVQIFEIILKYIYGGIVDIENTGTKTVYELIVYANELEFEELSLKTHFSLIYHSIYDENEFKSYLLFESGNFASPQETALISILKIDDLKIEEIKIWDYVIKWGIAQISTLQNFQTLRITL